MPNDSTSILPLPPEVAAQIQSSTAITSLTSVVLGLVANSLDAEAQKIDVSVDFGRGAFSVEDNGLGIPPEEFTEAGGLGKLYHTSKNTSVKATYGRNGAFLTSVAALSILTITSHHTSHTQHATLVLHRSRPAARLIPAPSHHNLSHREHGTRVTVQDLFGNMPVRVKQRAVGLENGENEKQFQLLIRQLVGLSLAWHKPISVTLKNADGSGRLQIRDSQDLHSKKLEKPPSPPAFNLSLIRSMLTQAGYIDPSGWDDWIKTSARTPFITIKGAISLQPAPSKHFQFISLGINPVNREESNNILYDEVNRLFALSSFGIQEEMSEIEEVAKLRRSKDRRFKSDGFTNKQLKGGGKGVDRLPMFYIRLELLGVTRLGIRNDVDTLKEGTLSGVLKVLGAMITSFLEENHFRPRSRLRKSERDAPKKLGALDTIKRLQKSSDRPQTAMSKGNSYQEHDFSAWSRIKVGTRVVRPATYTSSKSLQSQTISTEIDEPEAANPISPGTPNSANTRGFCPPPNPDCERTLEWRHLISGATVLVNARTGLVVCPHPPKRPQTAPSVLRTSTSPPPTVLNMLAIPNHIRTLTRSVSSPFIAPKPESWSGCLLRKWENPVFNTIEEAIPRVSLDGPNIEGSDILHGRRHYCSDVDIQRAFTQSSASFSARLSKTALKNARVISQIDKKFVLICMKEDARSTPNKECELLVLVDQHAADERIRVEGLLENLSLSSIHLAKPIIFEIQAREHNILARHAANFAAWGLIYDSHLPLDSPKCRVSVKALPSAVAERCRIEPKVLIELIRTEAWKRGEAGSSKSTKTCPQGLLDMLNSRACRSAIMFNDEITKEEAQTLIQWLGECNFPFQCAHGRPSMVPLVDLGTSSSLALGEKAFGRKNDAEVQKKEKGFGDAWRMWKPDIKYR